MKSRYATRLAPIFKNKAVVTYSPSIFNLIAIIIFTVFAIHPTIKTILERQKAIDDQKQVLSTLEKKSKDLSEGINQFNSIPDSTKIKFATILPNSTNVTCLVNDLSNTSIAAGTTITGLQVQSVDLKGTTKCILGPADLENFRKDLTTNLNLKEINFSLNSQANFLQLSNFLSLFNSSPRLLTIESASFNKPADSNLIIIINAKAYYFQ